MRGDGEVPATLRVDVLLDRLCLCRTRSQAARACEEGRVRLGGKPVRASALVRIGDRLELDDRAARIVREFRVLALPLRRISRAEARRGYEMLSERALEEDWGPAT